MNMLLKIKIALVALFALSSKYGLCGNIDILFPSEQTDTVLYVDVEQKTEFKMFRNMTTGEGFSKFIGQNLRYPV